MTLKKVLPLIFSFVTVAYGRTLNEFFQLTNGDGSRYTAFAGRYGMAIFGDYIVVGASKDDYKGVIDVGSATIFKKVDGDKFTRVKKLYPTDGVKKDHFGSSVAINSKYVVVGAAWQDGRRSFRRRGAVYVYDLKGHFKQKLLPLDKFYKKVSMFGWNVAIRDDHTIVVSSPWEDQVAGEYSSGGVYIFTLSKSGSWNLAQRLSRPHLVQSHFGYSVRLSSDNLIVNGGNTDNGNNEITVNIYTLNSSGKYELRQQVSNEMTFSNKSHDCKRGGCMDISGKDMVLLNYPYSVRFYENNGDAWVPKSFLDVDWMVRKFTSSKSVRAYVRLQNGVLLIGVWWDTNGEEFNPGTSESGAVFVYKKSKVTGKWKEKDILLPKDDAKSGDLFGKYVAFNGNLVAIKHLFSTSAEGSVYVYDISETMPTLPPLTVQPSTAEQKITLEPTEEEVQPKIPSTVENDSANEIPTVATSKPTLAKKNNNKINNNNNNNNNNKVESPENAEAAARSSEIKLGPTFMVITMLTLFLSTIKL